MSHYPGFPTAYDDVPTFSSGGTSAPDPRDARIAELIAVIQRQHEAAEAARYLIDRLYAVWLGKPVRDLDEADAAYQSSRKRVDETVAKIGNPAQPLS